jgi:hypothetical protein
MLPHISVPSTSLIDYLRKAEFLSLSPKSLLLAEFIVPDWPEFWPAIGPTHSGLCHQNHSVSERF